MTDFGTRLRRIRHERGLTLLQVASDIGCSGVYLSEVERGIERPPNREWCARVASAVGVNVAELWPFAVVGRVGAAEYRAICDAADNRWRRALGIPAGTGPKDAERLIAERYRAEAARCIRSGDHTNQTTPPVPSSAGAE